MAVDTKVPVKMREVTDDEVAFYQENGWVLLRELISPELAAEALETVKTTMEEAPSVERVRSMTQDGHKTQIADIAQWRDWHFLGRDDHIEPFRSIAYSKEIGRNAQKFLGRDVPINYHADMMAVKMPAGEKASGPTGFHQDWVNFPFDRVGFHTFWFALDEITPEMGAMRFYEGSHQAGPLGKTLVDGSRLPVDEYYADIATRYPLSDPIHLNPGDATVHNGMVVHGAPENSTDKLRWVFLCSYHPADTCYTGAPHHIFSPDLGMEIGKPIKHDLFPPIYP
jgi:ectoine hydroxylase-related dioxygenase (phytanoyl-CoA dioxygenase family)